MPGGCNPFRPLRPAVNGSATSQSAQKYLNHCQKLHRTDGVKFWRNPKRPLPPQRGHGGHPLKWFIVWWPCKDSKFSFFSKKWFLQKVSLDMKKRFSSVSGCFWSIYTHTYTLRTTLRWVIVSWQGLKNFIFCLVLSICLETLRNSQKLFETFCSLNLLRNSQNLPETLWNILLSSLNLLRNSQKLPVTLRTILLSSLNLVRNIFLQRLSETPSETVSFKILRNPIFA